MKTTFGNLTLELQQGDITKQDDLGAVVNAANAQLLRGGGVAGAIHKAAGPELEEECRPLAPISPGEAVVTAAYNLPNEYVIHTLGPVYGKDKPEAELLAECYRNSLARAEAMKVTSIGFPALSTGAFGYPMEEAAKVALETIRDEAPKLERVRLVRFVLFSGSDLELHQKVMEELTS